MTCAPPENFQNQKSFWIPSKQPPNICRAGWVNFFHQKHVFVRHPSPHIACLIAKQSLCSCRPQDNIIVGEDIKKLSSPNSYESVQIMALFSYQVANLNFTMYPPILTPRIRDSYYYSYVTEKPG